MILKLNRLKFSLVFFCNDYTNICKELAVKKV